MNVAYILPCYWPAIGGSEVHTRELVKGIARDHDVKVVTLINSQEEKLAHKSLWKTTTIHASGSHEVYMDNGAEVHKLSVKSLWNLALYPFMRSTRLYGRIEPLSMLFLTRIFHRKIKGLLTDRSLIHSVFGGLSYLSYTALHLAREKKIPFVFTPLLHLFDTSWHEKMLNSERTGQNFEYRPELHLNPMGYHDRYWVKTCREADALVTMTEFEREFLVSSLNIDKNKVHHLGVGPIVSQKSAPSHIREKYGISGDQAIVLFLGRNHELKGIEELCISSRLVWDKHPNTIFFFVGPKEGRSREIIENHKDKRIIEVENVTTEEKSNFLAACDIFCMPSLHESFGGVFLEAWAFEKPVIGADIPPLRELTDNGKGGFLINPVPENIAAKIIELIEHKDTAQRMGSWGKKRISSKYNWELIVDKMTQIYSSLL